MDVVVSGTSSGIGACIAGKFLQEGHAVFGFDVAPGCIDHERYMHFTHDIRDGMPDALELVEPEILVCNAGTQDDDSAIDVNLEGTIRFTESFIDSPRLRSVLFVASASARNGSEFPRYVASKAGVMGYMKNVALNNAQRGITCNSVSPGGVVTPANAHILENDRLYAAVLEETLLGKWAQPEEVAELVYFLTVVNRSITGEDILMDNGEMLKSNFIW
ncbi:MAG: SDR family oxidoreductase [Eggerthellaceae bacterium]|nr:SDR family oxidoreductase [Eggerthellaceae bacterium]